MAAVAPSHFSHSPGFYHPAKMAESRPSFTAVNGAPTAAPAPKPLPVDHQATDAAKEPAQNVITEPAPVATEVAPTPNGDTRGEPSQAERRVSPAPPLPSAPTPTLALASSSQQSNPPAATDQHHSPSTQHIERPDAPRILPPVNHVEGPHVQPSPAVLMSPQKRKRSLSRERENPPGPLQKQGGLPQSPARPEMPNGVENGPSSESYSPRQQYPPPQNYYQQPQTDAYPQNPQHSYPPPPEQPENSTEAYPRANGVARHDYEPPLDPSIASQQERPYYSESHLAEALQRENHNYDAMPERESFSQAEDEDDNPPEPQYTTYGGSREAGTADMDRKRRKRVFSNRTKTGCMTCRRRKKKCDEQHPECNNCLRGGFVCEGYTMRNTWQKPTNTKQPIPLQSKNGYPSQESTPTRAPYPQMSRYQENSLDYSPASQQQPALQSRPSYDSKRDSISEHDSVYGRTTPPSQNMQPAWSKNPAGRPYPSNPPAASKYQGDEHRNSIYETRPEERDPNAMPPPHVDRTSSTSSQYSQRAHTLNHNSTPPNQHAQAAAQAALTHPAASRPPTAQSQTQQLTERGKMLKGLYYFPNTPALTEDRERCIAAIWRFNNATNPSHGASPEERTRLFRQILALRPSPEPPLSNGEAPPTNYTLPFGSCGERVVVDAPFHCDYGYNITIGDDVLIGPDCRISDTCSVTIGARSILSPKVSLICATYPIDPRRRQGSNGPALGRNIVIEEDCWVGAGVTILAGVRVGKSSTVGAGSLLHQDVPRFTVVAGNPAKTHSDYIEVITPSDEDPRGTNLHSHYMPGSANNFVVNNLGSAMPAHQVEKPFLKKNGATLNNTLNRKNQQRCVDEVSRNGKAKPP
ncbi:uncharacterized protein KY384_006999 [Bacidia gigantensis]|uniref:uncharacterized protein n=1 Tax=Bacidia gigantensis TaxID=2732470 RepID=UPI001D038356|nr:uncharacterized protein KY384_006999 [Bacidia gigantensis]KAG8528083.1 hypothetical protein KY384_006999 [Bacidia gigantensis]